VNATALLVRKELRAVAGLWLGVVGAMLAGMPLARNDLREMGPLFYVIGALALGANAIGHEYRHGTMSQLLMQPVARRRLLAVKVAVLAVLLAAVAGVAAAAVFPRFRWSSDDRPYLIALFVLPLGYGFFVAPWLTLKTRHTLAGTLFSGALAALLLLGGEWIGGMWFVAAADIDAFKLRVLWTGSILLAGCAAVGLWRSFADLQVTDDVRSDVTLPIDLGITEQTTAARRHPVLLLVAKELRLQQLTFVGSVVYVLFCLSLWTRRASMPTFDEAISIATVIHAVVVAALTGAFSCADERALGTLQWQLQQPISARVQFGVKMSVTVALTLSLAIGLPALVLGIVGVHLRILPSVSVGVPILLALLAGSVYVSSVSSSAVVAFFSCVPTFMAALWFLQAVVGAVSFRTLIALHPPEHGGFVPLPRVNPGLAGAVALALVVLVLAFALENHRDGERSPSRIVLQVVTLAALVTVTSVAFAAAGRLLF
jgi:ABC-type transport system involved in multi-copper enzyme maturation permease subunit